MSLEFLLTSLIVVIAPGTGVLYTLTCALSRGAKFGAAAALGCTLGILPHMTASILGLAVVLHTSAVVFHMLKWVGVAYLLYLAWSTLRETGSLTVEGTAEGRGLRDIAVKGFLINILNPKLSIFFLAFLPQFVSADSENPTLATVGLAAVFMAMTFIVFVGYGFFAAVVRKHVISRQSVMAWLRRLFAGAFAALGLKLAFEER